MQNAPVLMEIMLHCMSIFQLFPTTCYFNVVFGKEAIIMKNASYYSLVPSDINVYGLHIEYYVLLYEQYTHFAIF